MPYTAKNWSKTASVLKSILDISPPSGKNDFPRPEILQEPFFSDDRLDALSREIGRENLARIYLEKLNARLLQADLFPLFGNEIIRFSTLTGGMVYFDGVKEILDTGTDVKMVILPFSESRSNYLAFQGNFTPLMLTKSAYKQAGALGVNISRLNSQIPPGNVRGRVSVDDETLKWLNSRLSERRLSNLPKSMASQKSDSQKISRSEITFFDQNQTYFTVVNLAGHTLRFSRQNDKHSEGEIFAARDGRGEIICIDELRPLLGCRERSLVRGFSKTKNNGISELEEETGIKTPPDSFLKTQKIITSRLYDYSRPNLNFIRLSDSKIKENSKEDIIISESGFESIRTIRLTDKQIVEQIISGQIWDAFTISSLARLWLEEKVLQISDRASGFGVVLEYRGWASGEEGYTIPYVPIDAGIKISEIVPDSGCARIIHPVKLITLADLPADRKYELKSIPDILSDISAGFYDTPTVSALLLSLLHQGLLTPAV